MKQLSEEELKEYIDTFEKLISIIPEPRQSKIKAMLDGPIGAEYFTSPASSKEEFHSSYPGGLLVHSLNVVKNLNKIASALAPGKYDKAQIAFVGLFHDFGKVGDGVEPYYIMQKSDWHLKKGINYEINDKCLRMPNAERGLYLLQKHDIELTPEEYVAIRTNDGQYDQGNIGYKGNYLELPMFVHWADLYSCAAEKAGD